MRFLKNLLLTSEHLPLNLTHPLVSAALSLVPNNFIRIIFVLCHLQKVVNHYYQNIIV